MTHCNAVRKAFRRRDRRGRRAAQRNSLFSLRPLCDLCVFRGEELLFGPLHFRDDSLTRNPHSVHGYMTSPLPPGTTLVISMNPGSRASANTRWTLTLFACVLVPAHTTNAQQREPAVEVFGLTGGYFHGNLSLRHDWRPQFGGGVLLPLGRSWAALFDAATSKVESYWQHDGCIADGTVYCGWSAPVRVTTTRGSAASH